MGNGNAVLANPGTPNSIRSSTLRKDAAYEDFYPYYAELCALSELRKKSGFGIGGPQGYRSARGTASVGM
mgnify:CR=1 FL=1